MSAALQRRPAAAVAVLEAVPEEAPLPLNFERAYRLQRSAAATPPAPSSVKEAIIAWLNAQL